MLKKIFSCAVLLVVGCSSGKQDAGANASGQIVQSVTDPTKKAVGAACTASDGWRATTDPAASNLAVNGQAQAIAVTDRDTDRTTVAPGVLYCLEPGGVFPNGYMTSNCKEHSDCPAGTLCDDVHCRLPCKADSDCLAPSVCGVPAGAHQVRFCSCNECVHREVDR